MPFLMLKEVPRYECLREASSRLPGADPGVCELFLNILHTGDLAARSEADFLARHGLNQARMIILVLLDNAEAGSLRSSELADRANVSRATMTGLLDTLEKAGLLTRAPDPHDRRASNVKITPQGEEILHRVQPLQFQWAQQVLAPLQPDERAELVRLLQKAQQAFLTQAVPTNGNHP